MKVALSVGVQAMVRSDKAGAGVMFSIDTESGFPRSVLINSAWGLGETVVQGMVEPDEYHVFKSLLDNQALRPIIEKALGGKAKKMIYATGSQATSKLCRYHQEGTRVVLDDDEVLKLVHRGVQKIHPFSALASPESRDPGVRRQGRMNLLSAPMH